VRAAFLKCCVEAAGLTPGADRIARAVARTHVDTGAPITVHTSARARTGRLALDLFASEGVDLTKVVVGHAGDSNDLDYLMGLADTGAVLGMDRFGLDSYNPTARGYADRMVLSHDASCFIDYWGGAHDRVRATMPDWHFGFIGDTVLPALRAGGVTEAQINGMLVETPRRYFGT
jgi:phosphotriesterase-related protein